MSPRSLRSSACLIASLAALGAPAFAEPLTVSNWDGYMAADAIDSFNAADRQSRPNWSLHATNEEIMGKLIASKRRGL